MRHTAIPALLLAAGIAAGCGYGLVGRTSNLPADVENIFVEELGNRTLRTQVNQILTRAISDEFVTRRRFNIVSDRSKADAVLSGEVLSFVARPVAFSGGRANTYEILIDTRMAFKRRDDGQVIWQSDRYQFRENYEVEISATAYFDTENLAIEEVAEKFAETLITDLLEGF